MKHRYLILVFLLFSGCGYVSRHNTMVGQAKKLVNATPLLCSERVDADVSMGVLRNGNGSISREDIWFTVPNKADIDTLTKAAADGLIVTIEYDVLRINFCWRPHVVTHVEITH